MHNIEIASKGITDSNKEETQYSYTKTLKSICEQSMNMLNILTTVKIDFVQFTICKKLQSSNNKLAAHY